MSTHESDAPPREQAEVPNDETTLLGSSDALDIGKVLEVVGQGRYQQVAVVCLGIANASDAVEILAIGYILAVFQDPISHQDVDREGGISGALSASVFVGMLLGGFFSGLIGDRIGRKPVLFSTLSVNFLSSLGSSMTLHMPEDLQILWFLACRFVGGAGVGGSVPAVFALASEMCTESKRGLYVTIVAWFWMVGALYTAAMGWLIIGDRDLAGSQRWPYFALAVAMPAGTASMLVRLLVLESPRYLMSLGRVDEALVVARKMAAWNGTLDETNRYIATFDNEGQSHNTVSMVRSKKICYGVSSDIKQYTRTLITLGLVWFCLSYGGYGIGAWISDLFKSIGFQNIYGTSFFYALGNLPGNIGATLLIERVARYKLVSVSMGCAAFASILFAVSLSPFWIITGAVLFNTFVIGSWNGLNVLSAESFPPSVRSSAFGVISAVGRLGSVTGTLVNGILLGGGYATVAILLAGFALTIGSVVVRYV